MGILDGKNWRGFRRVRLRKAEARSVKYLSPSLCSSRDYKGKITLGSIDIVRVRNLDHEFGESRSTLQRTDSLGRREGNGEGTNVPSTPWGQVLLGSHLRILT
jgi:hypothetical protein